MNRSAGPVLSREEREELERAPSPGFLQIVTGHSGEMGWFLFLGLYSPGAIFVLLLIVELVELLVGDPNAMDLQAMMLMMLMVTVMGMTFGYAYDPARLDYEERQREKRAVRTRNGPSDVA